MPNARKVSTQAKITLEAGGLATKKGEKALKELDRELRDPKHELNPGTTADLSASVLALAILKGCRP